MKINQTGIDLIKEFEGLRLRAYKDLAGVFTIGYGSTGPDIVDGLIWTPEQANERLAKDLERFEEGVSRLVRPLLTSNQFSALVCFSYNVGLSNLKQSTLLRCINTNHLVDATSEFVKWNHCAGKVIEGLTRRRLAERALFLR